MSPPHKKSARQQPPFESTLRLTTLQLEVLSEAFETTNQWADICAKRGLSRQNVTKWRATPEWKAEWARREAIVLEEQTAHLRRAVAVGTRTLLELAQGQGKAPRVDKNGRVLPGAPAPVPYTVQQKAAETLVNLGKGRRELGEEKLEPEETLEDRELRSWLRASE